MNLESTTMTQNSNDDLVTSNDLIFSKIGCNSRPIGCQNGQFWHDITTWPAISHKFQNWKQQKSNFILVIRRSKLCLLDLIYH